MMKTTIGLIVNVLIAGALGINACNNCGNKGCDREYKPICVERVYDGSVEPIKPVKCDECYSGLSMIYGPDLR